MSNTTKRIVCLANSRKLRGRCIAGKEILLSGSIGEWIRPISSRPTEEVPEYRCRYRDGSELAVLDVIEVPLLEARPEQHQQENWLLTPNFNWRKMGEISPRRLNRLTDPVSPLWINGDSSFNGENDRISESAVIGITDSLRLVRLREMELNVYAPGAAFRNLRRRVQGHFRHGGIDYSLWITDPKYEQKYLEKPDGIYTISECFVTISLGERHQDGYAYKLIAAIIEPD